MNYEIKGAPYPVAEVYLNSGESVNCQKGAMIWMSPNMHMSTNMGGSGLGGILKRAVSGESIFQNTYTAQGDGMIAFGSSFPGEIMGMYLEPGMTIIAQKKAFLASAPSVNFEVAFQKIGAGLFGGEGFIMQRFTGQGMLLLEIDGSIIERTLAPGETMLVDNGFVAAMEGTVSMEIERIKGIGNVLAGGEGLTNVKITGPGKVWLQTMPINQFISAISGLLPTRG